MYVLFHSLHNSPMYWDSPAAFWPERWQMKGAQNIQSAGRPELHLQHTDRTSGESDSRDPLKRFLPFSDGPRSCIAQVLQLQGVQTQSAHQQDAIQHLNTGVLKACRG